MIEPPTGAAAPNTLVCPVAASLAALDQLAPRLLAHGATAELEILRSALAKLAQQHPLQAALDLVGAGVLLCDAQGRLRYTNRAAAGLLGVVPGWQPQPGPPLPAALFGADGAPGSVASALRQGLRGATVRLADAHGSLRWLQVDVEPELRPDGAITGLVVSLVDVSERYALAESRVQLDLAVDAAGLGLFEVDLGALRLHGNPRSAAMLGLSGAALNLPLAQWRERIHPDDRDVTMAAFDSCVQGVREEFRAELRLRREDGRWLWVEAFGRVLQPLVPGAAARVLGAFFDIGARKQAEQEIHRLASFPLSNPRPVAEFARDGRLLFANPALRAIASQADERVIASFFPAEFARLLPAVQTQPVRGSLILEALGRQYEAVVCYEPSYDSIRVYMDDVTERNRDRSYLMLTAKVIEHSAEGILLVDAHARVERVNRAFTELTGASEDQVEGCLFDDVLPNRDGGSLWPALFECVSTGGYWQQEAWLRRFDGGHYLAWLRATAIAESDNHPAHVVVLATDITERHLAEERIAHLAYHDPLTGLPNRRLLRERFNHAAAHAQRSDGRLALIFLDLDHFKQVNDTYGHPVGDALLVALADRLRASVRQTDTVARLGGDEFVLLADSTREVAAYARLADKLLERIQLPLEIGAHRLLPSCSLGVALYPDHGGDFETLLRQADDALLTVKQAGRGGWRFAEPPAGWPVPSGGTYEQGEAT